MSEVLAPHMPAGFGPSLRLVGDAVGLPLDDVVAQAELATGWQLGDTGWHVSVRGDAPMEVDIRFAVPLERMAAVSPAFTANRAVNVVAAVCAAEPGIRSSVELPQIIPRPG